MLLTHSVSYSPGLFVHKLPFPFPNSVAPINGLGLGCPLTENREEKTLIPQEVIAWTDRQTDFSS